jgi:hypothetical protein
MDIYVPGRKCLDMGGLQRHEWPMITGAVAAAYFAASGTMAGELGRSGDALFDLQIWEGGRIFGKSRATWVLGRDVFPRSPRRRGLLICVNGLTRHRTSRFCPVTWHSTWPGPGLRSLTERPVVF